MKREGNKPVKFPGKTDCHPKKGWKNWREVEMAQKRINTAKTLGNETFYNGGLDTTVISTTSIAVSPLVSD